MARIPFVMAAALSLALAVGCGDKDDDGDSGAESTDGTDGTDGADGTADGTDGTAGSDGATVYTATCNGCHGPNGNDGFGADLTVEVPARSDAELQDVIQNGSGSMAAQNLTDADLEAVTVYLRATFG